jgi:hypothetical protein
MKLFDVSIEPPKKSSATLFHETSQREFLDSRNDKNLVIFIYFPGIKIKDFFITAPSSIPSSSVSIS